MRIGKISENVLIRSVLRKIKTKREEVLCGAGIGIDCAVLSFDGNDETVISTNPVSAPTDMVCCYGIHRALNNIAAAAAEPVGIMISAVLPEDTEEKELQDMMKQAETLAGRFNVQIIGGHTEVMPDIKTPVLTITGIGKRSKSNPSINKNDTSVINIGRDAATSKGIKTEQDTIISRKIKTGQDVIISKWIGLEGTVRLAREHKDELITRYPIGMIDDAAEFEQFLSVIPEAATAVKSGVCGMHDVSSGGIFAALWEMADSAGVGLEVELKKLPIRQETIEICEFYDLNPYELLSGGCLLMTAENGTDLVMELEKAGIPAVIVGKTTAGNDRVILNEEERRFLEPPKTDQIYQMYYDRK
ncbi:MAG: hydrogenase maturation factor [Lachnospiraceae bacterium]|nr:hydrogenase maturation factor [Lachnospiraceae bacterium]